MSNTVERQAIGRADSGITTDDGCRQYRNGVGPYAGHCAECDVRLYLIARSARRAEYRIRDYDGRVISDWRM